MRTFLNNHPYLGLALCGMVCATIITVANITHASKQPNFKVACINLSKDDKDEETEEEIKEDKKD